MESIDGVEAIELLEASQVIIVKTAPWLKELQGTIKCTYGPGWVLEERSGFLKIQRREAGKAKAGKCPTITSKIRFAPCSSTDVLVRIGELKRITSCTIQPDYF